MGYSSNTNFSPLTDSIGLVIDGCGDTHEKKYYVNGTYIDLCGMSIKDYMENPCCCNGGTGNSDGDKLVNKILVKSFKDKSDFIYYQAIATFAVASYIKVTVTSTNGVVTELDLYAGETESIPEIGETIDFSEITLSVDMDDAYKYMLITEEEQSNHVIYNKAILLTELGSFSEDFTTSLLEDGGTVDIDFIVPAGDVNYNEMTDITEFEQYCMEHQYCFSLFLPKNIYDTKKYSITNYGTDITSNFIYNNEISIGGIAYIGIVEKATDDIMPFVQLYNEENVYNYKLTLNK